MKECEKEQIQEILETLPDHLNVMEQGIDAAVQKEYLNASEALMHDTPTSEEVFAESVSLFLKDTPLASKKRLLILLAHSATPRAYRIIERYLKNPDRELGDWALLTLQECLTLLESAILEESRGMISTGLGGSDSRLRYFLLISLKTGELFTKDQEELIQEEFDLVCRKHDCQIESGDFDRDYAALKMLVPLDVAVGHVIEQGINECNKTGIFLSSTYYVTNVKIPSEEELLRLRREIRE